MKLRDILVENHFAHRNRLEFQIRIPQMIAEWQAAVEDLLDTIQTYLAPYEREGIVGFETRTGEVKEESLGTYAVKELIIHSGDKSVLVKARGRLTMGSLGCVQVGRLDGKNPKTYAVSHIKDNDALVWRLDELPDDETATFASVISRKSTGVTLNKDDLERILADLLTKD